MAKALIIDDSRFMRNIIRETLESGGHTILAEGEDGGEAVALYKEHHPDFMTMDITMHGKDGMEAADEILALDPKAVIFVVSAMNEQVINSTRNHNRVTAYVTKPFSKEELLDTVAKHLPGAG